MPSSAPTEGEGRSNRSTPSQVWEIKILTRGSWMSNQPISIYCLILRAVTAAAIVATGGLCHLNQQISVKRGD